MPEYLFHGTPNGDIVVLEPRKIATPTIECGASPPRVYAGSHPAYSAGHGFSWATREGVDLSIEGDNQGKEIVKLSVPKAIATRLEQPVHVYTLPVEPFELLPNVEPVGYNYASTVPVKPLSKKSFPNVRTAVEFYGGVVVITD